MQCVTCIGLRSTHTIVIPYNGQCDPSNGFSFWRQMEGRLHVGWVGRPGPTSPYRTKKYPTHFCEGYIVWLCTLHQILCTLHKFLPKCFPRFWAFCMNLRLESSSEIWTIWILIWIHWGSGGGCTVRLILARREAPRGKICLMVSPSHWWGFGGPPLRKFQKIDSIGEFCWHFHAWNIFGTPGPILTN